MQKFIYVKGNDNKETQLKDVNELLENGWVVKEMQSQPVTEGGSPICFLLLEKETKTE